MKQEFLMQASEATGKESLGRCLMSVKLDGKRFFWDGGITRGVPKEMVPWANTAKDARYKEQQIATGLWSRYANVIHAPDWWLDQLPRFPIDGELFSYDIMRDELFSITSSQTKGDGWKQVVACVFDSPPLPVLFRDRIIDNPNFKKKFSGIMSWIMMRPGINDMMYFKSDNIGFQSIYTWLQSHLAENDVVILHQQDQLPMRDEEADAVIEANLNGLVPGEDEGLIIRAGHMPYVTERVKFVIKKKLYQDAEGIVAGYVGGEKRHLGRLGSLRIKYGEIEFDLSGMDDKDRTLSTDVSAYEGKPIPFGMTESRIFPLGTKITFKYRGLSSHGTPIEASYDRIREQE